MRALLLSALSLCLVSAVCALGTPTQALKSSPSAPPGMVEIQGGKTYIGSTVKDIEAILATFPPAKNALRPLDAETPQIRVDVPTFFLHVNELTNEQYRVFVMATGHRPPFEWGQEAIEAATLAYLKAENDKKVAARKQGTTHESRPFDAPEWWDANWRGASWAMPPESALRPVVYVDYSDVLAYCKWAGLRPPTEYEFQRAVRGNSKNPYPWGEDWHDTKYARTDRIRGRQEPSNVGSFPAGTSPDGVVDLIGNVWEWTSSPYEPHKGFKKNEYTFGKGRTKETKVPEPVWDANQRVVTGGAWQAPNFAARASVRRPTERTQMANALGFRCAASANGLGRDVAAAIHRTEVQGSEARGEGVDFDTGQTIAIDRWETAAEVAEGAPEGYAVITDYDYMLFVPLEQFELTQDVDLEKASLVAPVQLGFFSTTEAILEPALAPGTYVIAYRAAGKAAVAAAPKAEGEEGDEQEQEAAGPVEDPLAGLIDINKHNVLIFDVRTGELAAKIERTTALKFGSGTGGGSIRPFEKKVFVKDEKGKDVPATEMWMLLDLAVKTKIRNRQLGFDIQLKPEPETIAKKWRS